MPKKKRDVLKKIASQAHNDCERCLHRIKQLHEIFAPVHPDYAEFLLQIAQGVMMIEDMIEDFWRNAWGTVPEDFNSYR